jgi:hypothetical protein
MTRFTDSGASRFFYVSGGLFLLSLTLLIGVHIGQRTARADWNGSGLALGTAQFGGYPAYGGLVVAADGSTWSLRDGVGWQSEERLAYPVPVSQIKFFLDQRFIIDQSDNAYEYIHDAGGERWINHGPIPLTTPTRSTTWGNLKTRFSEENGK